MVVLAGKGGRIRRFTTNRKVAPSRGGVFAQAGVEKGKVSFIIHPVYTAVPSAERENSCRVHAAIGPLFHFRFVPFDFTPVVVILRDDLPRPLGTVQLVGHNLNISDAGCQRHFEQPLPFPPRSSSRQIGRQNVCYNGICNVLCPYNRVSVL